MTYPRREVQSGGFGGFEDGGRAAFWVEEGQTLGASKLFTIDAGQAAELTALEPLAAKWIHPLVTSTSLLDNLRTVKYVIDLPLAELERANLEAPRLVERLKRIVLPRRCEDLRSAQARPTRDIREYERQVERWCQLRRRRDDLIQAIANGDARYLVTPRNPARGRLMFDFVAKDVRPSDSLIAFGLADDYSFGVLSSGVHEAMMRRHARRYTVTFAKQFIWPRMPGPREVGAVSALGAELLSLRYSLRKRGVSLAAQYSPGEAIELSAVHSALDEAVLKAYQAGCADDVKESFARGYPPRGYRAGPGGPPRSEPTSSSTWCFSPRLPESYVVRELL